jgi:hypothetical protein
MQAEQLKDHQPDADLERDAEMCDEELSGNELAGITGGGPGGFIRGTEKKTDARQQSFIVTDPDGI